MWCSLMRRARGSACLSLAPLTPPCSLPSPSWMYVLLSCFLLCPVLPSSEPHVLPSIVSPVLFCPVCCLLLCPMLPSDVPPVLPFAVPPVLPSIVSPVLPSTVSLVLPAAVPCATFCCALCCLCHSHPSYRLLCPVLALMCLPPSKGGNTSNPMFLPVLFVCADVCCACLY